MFLTIVTFCNAAETGQKTPNLSRHNIWYLAAA